MKNDLCGSFAYLLGKLEQMNGFCTSQFVFAHSPPVFFLLLIATQRPSSKRTTFIHINKGSKFVVNK
jgi:hypothetical protein